MAHPVSGPVPIDEFRALVNAPAGEARKRIQKYDPLFGRAEGEKIKWQVTFTGRGTGYATVMAASQKEAEKVADGLSDAEIDWEDMEVDGMEVEPIG